MKRSTTALLLLLAACGSAPRDDAAKVDPTFRRLDAPRADSLAEFVRWLDSMTPIEYAMARVRVAGASSAVSEPDLAAAARAAYRTSLKPHTRLHLLRLGSADWAFVVRRAVDPDEDPEVRREAVRTVASARTEAGRRLARTFLVDPDGLVRKIAAFEFVRQGKEAWPELKALVASRDPYVRWGAAMALALWDARSIGDDDPFPAREMAEILLKWVIEEESPYVVQYVPVAARTFYDAAARKAPEPEKAYNDLARAYLKALVRPGTDSTKSLHCAKECLRLLADRCAVEKHILVALPEPFFVWYIHTDYPKGGVLAGYGDIPFRAMAGILAVAATEPWARSEVLTRLPYFTNDMLVQHYESFRSGKRSKFPAEIDAILRLEAIHILATRGDARAVEPLRSELRSGAPAPYATWFSNLLIELAPGRATADFLGTLAADRSLRGETRAGALTGYAIAMREDALALLKDALADRDEAVRARAAQVLGLAGYYLRKEESVYPLLASALSNEKSPAVRESLVTALAMLRTADPDAERRESYSALFFKVLGISK